MDVQETEFKPETGCTAAAAAACASAAALCGGLQHPRQKEQLPWIKATHTERKATHLQERRDRCKQARGASEGYILSPDAPAATSLKAKYFVEGYSPAAVLSRCAGLHFFRFFFFFFFCQRPAVCAWRNSDEDGTTPPLWLWFDNLGMSTSFIGRPFLSVQRRCRRRLHHKARHFGVRATTRHTHIGRSKEAAAAPGGLFPQDPGQKVGGGK